MMDRRSFALGLGALGLGLSLPCGATQAGSRQKFEAMRKNRNIPFTPFEQIPNHRQLMRDIVQVLSGYAKARNPHFGILARNAPELLVKDRREWDLETGQDIEGAAAEKYSPVGSIISPYQQAIDAMLIDGLFCGMNEIDHPTEQADAKPFLDALVALRKENRRVLSIEYAKDKQQVSAALKKAEQAKVLAYLDQDGNKLLGHIPGSRPPAENAQHVTGLDGVRNFLPMLQATSFANRAEWISALAETNYDLLLVDPFWRDEGLTFADVKALKQKRLGSDRLVFARLSLGRALTNRFYWKKEWTVGSPAWLVEVAPEQSDPIIVRYWDNDWKAILGKFMQGLIDLGFGGVLLDDLDTYLYFEAMMPIK